MKTPAITAFYLGILVLMYAVLALWVAGLRQRNRTGFGDGGDATLRTAIRAHANFIEYVPIISLLVALLEMSGSAAMRVHLMMAALVLSRLLHPLGMAFSSGTWQFKIGRVGGILLTIALLVSTGISAMIRFWPL